MTSIDRILAAILHLGNIEFEDQGGVTSVITTEEEVGQVARLLGVDKEVLVRILTKRMLPSQKELIEASLPPLRAKFTRDALAKVPAQYSLRERTPRDKDNLCIKDN